MSAGQQIGQKDIVSIMIEAKAELEDAQRYINLLIAKVDAYELMANAFLSASDKNSRSGLVSPSRNGAAPSVTRELQRAIDEAIENRTQK